MRQLVLFILVFWAYAGQAADLAVGNEPVYLSAQELGYDRKQSRVIAQGDVKIVQGDIIIFADRLTYLQSANEVYASGNISLRQPNGDVLFADNIRLKDNLESGVIQDFRARLANNSLFAAREARKINENVIELDKAVYSPCKICDGKSPLWQMKADAVTIDQEAERIEYENARLELWGVPVAYTPYFSHATPDAKAKTGFLAPEVGSDSELGSFVKIPGYLSIAPNIDAVLAPSFLSNEAPVLAAEYRHLFSNGLMEWSGSITNPTRRNSSGQEVDGTEIRGHINAFGNFELSDDWSWGFNLNRTTDDTYMRRYNIASSDMLTSRLYAENIKGRRYLGVQALAFQGLTIRDNSDTTPLISPIVEYSYETDPGWLNSRVNMQASSTILSRNIGAQSRRLTLETGWEVPYITQGGHVLEAKTSLRGDIYSVENVARDGFAQDYDGNVARVIPQAELSWRYPLINHYAPGRSLLIEPVAQFIMSPSGANTSKIPNEDSVIPEFNDANLFDGNRFAGYDRIETGPRFNYGIQGLWQFADTRNLDFLFGQHYRSDEENPFPFNNDLTENQSDYVGRLALTWDTHFSTAYRFRLDKESLAPKRSEVNGLVNFDPVFFQVDYLNLNNDPFLDNREEVVATGSVAVTDYWTLFAGTRRDLQESQQTAANAGFKYTDECFNLYGNLSRSLIRDRDIEPSTSFVVRVELESLN